MRRLHKVALMLAIVVLAAGLWWLRKEMAIDSCLDGGGTWDYSANQCATD